MLKPRLIELLKHRAVEVRTQPAPPRGRGPDVKLERVPAPALPAWESAEAGDGQGEQTEAHMPPTLRVPTKIYQLSWNECFSLGSRPSGQCPET